MDGEGGDGRRVTGRSPTRRVKEISSLASIPLSSSLHSNRNSSRITTSPTQSISAVSSIASESRFGDTNRFKEKLNDQIQIAESLAHSYAMLEHIIKEEFNKKIKELDEEVEKQKTEIERKKDHLQKKIERAKAVKSVKERHDVEMAAAKELVGVPSDLETDVIEKKDQVIEAMTEIGSPIKLKNFKHLSKSETDEMAQDFKDMSLIMNKLEEYIKSSNADEAAIYLPTTVNKIKAVQDIAQICEQEEVEVNDLMLRYSSLMLGKLSNEEKKLIS